MPTILPTGFSEKKKLASFSLLPPPVSPRRRVRHGSGRHGSGRRGVRPVSRVVLRQQRRRFLLGRCGRGGAPGYRGRLRRRVREAPPPTRLVQPRRQDSSPIYPPTYSCPGGRLAVVGPPASDFPRCGSPADSASLSSFSRDITEPLLLLGAGARTHNSTHIASIMEIALC
jgi:hypothetical protein